MAIIISGKDYVSKHIDSLKTRCLEISKKKVPFMKVILVGANPASLSYVSLKKKLCEKVGAKCEIVEIHSAVKSENFLKIIHEINTDPEVDGLIIQLPLPAQLKKIDIYNLVNPKKDIDGFHIQNFKNVYDNTVKESSLIPCTPKGVMKLLDYHNIILPGKNVVIIGRSKLVGKPLFHLMLNRNATVTLCHSKTENLTQICKRADVVVIAVGNSRFYNLKYSHEKQIIIDVGVSRDKAGILCGDADFSQLEDSVHAITPVPGGVGPMTVFSLIENLLIATKKNNDEN